MKRLAGLLLIFAMSISIIGCSGNNVKETVIVENNASETGTSMQETGKRMIEVEVGEPFLVNAKYGQYIVTINGMEKTDWWQRKHNNDVKHVLLIHYEVENVSFSSLLSSGVQLNPDSFKITGSNNYAMSAFATYYDDVEPVGNVEPGEKKSGSMAYEIDKEADAYTVIFKNSTGDLAKTYIDLQ